MGHHPGDMVVSSGTPLPGWAILLILGILTLLVYLGWRWWKNLNKPAF